MPILASRCEPPSHSQTALPLLDNLHKILVYLGRNLWHTAPLSTTAIERSPSQADIVGKQSAAPGDEVIHGAVARSFARWIGLLATWRDQERLKRGLSAFVLGWSIVAILEFTLQLLVPRSALRSSELPPGARLLLFCYALTILTIVASLAIVTIRLVIAAFIRPLSLRFAADRLARAFTMLLVWLLLILYGASWGLFWQTGSFIDSQVFIFLAPHPLQVFHWVDRDIAFLIIASAGVIAWTLIYQVPRWSSRPSPDFRSRILRVGSGLWAACLVGAVLGQAFTSWGDRRFTRSGIVYTRYQELYAGPFPYAVTDLKRYLRPGTETLTIDPRLETRQRPIIPLSEYIARAEQRGFRRWNVVMLIVESLRADQLRAYGGSREVMPAVEALAKNAKVFLNTYAQSSHTNYATLTPLSSHYPLRSAVAYTYPRNPSYPRVLIYDLLKGLGYRTALFSSSNENWGGMINYLDTGGLDRFVHAANSERPTYVMQGDDGFAAWVRETRHAGSLDDRATVDEAIRWIEDIGDANFFVALNLQNSHLPYPIPPDFPRRFGPAKLDFTIRFAHFPKDRVQVVKDVYADSLAYVDSQIARLFQSLKASDKWDNTLVVLTADHGQAFYEHGFASHASAIYDEVMKVPLIIRAPELEPGTDPRLAQHVDIAPTLVGLLGLPQHPSFQGIDLFGAPPNPNRSAYMVAQTPDAYQYGVVRAGFKLIHDERRKEYFLFDLSTDPGEKTNLAADRPAVVKELTGRLNAWRKLQVDYYSDAAIHTREYPPVLED